MARASSLADSLSGRRLAIAIAVCAILLAGTTGRRSLAWIGRVFPGFAILDNRVIQPFSLPQWGVASRPDLYLTEIVRMNGEPVASGRALYWAVWALPADTPVRYTIRDANGEREITLATQRFSVTDWLLSSGVTLFVGLVFAGSAAVLVLQRGHAVVRTLATLFACLALLMLSFPDTTAPPIFLRLAAASCALLPAATLNAALAFPVPHPLLRFQRLTYLLSAGLMIAFQAVLYDPPHFSRMLIAICVVVAAMHAGWSYRVLRAYWAPSSRLARQRAQVVTLATALGFGLPAMVTVVSAALGGVAVSPALGALTAPLIPLSFAYAVVKHDLFEIDAFVKRGTYYLVLSGLVVASYVAALIGSNWLLHRGVGIDPAIVAVLCALVVLLLLNPVRARLQRTVDRVLFGARYDGAQSLALAAGELAAALDRRQIASIVERCVQAAIPNPGTRLFTLASDAAGLIDVLDGTPLPAALASGLAARRPVTTVDAREAYPDAVTFEGTQQALADLEGVLAVPILLQGALVGSIVVGPKRYGLYYTAADGAFLQALAHAVAIALQNADSFERLAALNRNLETRVRDRTRDVEAAHAALQRTHDDLRHAHEGLKETQLQLVHAEKMASLGRLAAGVAHEINNPLSFMTATLEPLERRLERAARDASPETRHALEEARELMAIMVRGAERTAGIVADLRTFSRLQAAERKAVDLHAGLDMAVRLLEPRWQGRITIHRDYGTLPPVEGDARELSQVFMNLLGNACDAIPAAGNVWIATHAEGAWIYVSIQDDGEGIPPTTVRRLFEPFFTTKPVGQGAGLGLAVSHGIVAGHGGRIEVMPLAAGGALFRVSLPAASGGTSAATGGGP